MCVCVCVCACIYTSAQEECVHVYAYTSILMKCVCVCECIYIFLWLCFMAYQSLMVIFKKFLFIHTRFVNDKFVDNNFLTSQNSFIYTQLCGAFNKFPDFFVQAFKIVVDSWKFTMLLLYILWDDWPIFRISASNEQLQQQLEYTLLKPDCHSWWISKNAIWTRGDFRRTICNKILF